MSYTKGTDDCRFCHFVWCQRLPQNKKKKSPLFSVLLSSVFVLIYSLLFNSCPSHAVIAITYTPLQLVHSAFCGRHSRSAGAILLRWTLGGPLPDHQSKTVTIVEIKKQTTEQIVKDLEDGSVKVTYRTTRVVRFLVLSFQSTYICRCRN